MSTPALTSLIRFLAATVMDLHRYCRIYFAEEFDRRDQEAKR